MATRFSQALNGMLTERGISVEHLSRVVYRKIDDVDGWLRGESVPARKSIISFPLSEEDKNHLLDLAMRDRSERARARISSRSKD